MQDERNEKKQEGLISKYVLSSGKALEVNWFSLVIWFWLFLSVSWITFNMTVGNFSSDYPAHIRFALSDEEAHYSLTLYLFRMFYKISGDTKLISMFMGFVVAMSGKCLNDLNRQIYKNVYSEFPRGGTLKD